MMVLTKSGRKGACHKCSAEVKDEKKAAVCEKCGCRCAAAGAPQCLQLTKINAFNIWDLGVASKACGEEPNQK